jgi:bifunctional DNase/RNase
MPDEPEDDSGDLEQPPPFFPYGNEGDRPSGTMGEPVEVSVMGVFSGAADNQVQRFVLLRDDEGRQLPIMIGPFEAQAILMPLEGAQPDRPMTHDLLKSVMERLGAVLDRIVIDDLWSSTYYAKLYLRTADEEFEMDSRPSDAIALAIRYGAPIFASEGIMNQNYGE